MDKYIFDESNGLRYEHQGDYCPLALYHPLLYRNILSHYSFYCKLLLDLSLTEQAR